MHPHTFIFQNVVFIQPTPHWTITTFLRIIPSQTTSLGRSTPPVKATLHYHILALLFYSLTMPGLGQSAPEPAATQVRKRLEESLRGQIKAFLLQQVSKQQSPGAPAPPPEFV